MKMIALVLFLCVSMLAYGESSIVPKPGKTSIAQPLPGHLVQISAKGNELWGLTKLHQILRWNNNQNEWQTIPGFAHYVSAGTDGQGWHVGNEFTSVFRYNTSTGGWDSMSSNIFSSIAAYSGQVALYVVDGKITTLTMKSGTADWVPLVESDTKTLLAAMGEAGEIWRIDENSLVHRYDAQNQNWQPQDLSSIKAKPTYIDVQNANRVVLTDSAYNAWLWNGSVWHQVVESGLDPDCAQATINSDAVFCIDRDGNVFRYAV